MEWKTRVTELLGCRYPIIQGAYGGFGTSAIAVPVSEAGGFGIITAGALRTPDKFREDIRRARSLTDKPFGINLSVGICPHIEEMREVAIEERVPVIFTAAYNGAEHGLRAKAAGLKWVHKVATVKHAIAAERQGADAVVLVGLEGTGFKSTIQLPTLIGTTVASRILRVPLVAAGGIGDARGFVAALGMGAEAVYLGTAFMATKECPISDKYKQALVDGQPWDAKYRDRALAPPKPEEYEKVLKERASLPKDQWLPRLEAVLLKESSDIAPREWERDYLDDNIGDEEAFRIAGGSLAVGVIDRVVSVKELIDSIIAGAEATLGSNAPLGLVRK